MKWVRDPRRCISELFNAYILCRWPVYPFNWPVNNRKIKNDNWKCWVCIYIHLINGSFPRAKILFSISRVISTRVSTRSLRAINKKTWYRIFKANYLHTHHSTHTKKPNTCQCRHDVTDMRKYMHTLLFAATNHLIGVYKTNILKRITINSHKGELFSNFHECWAPTKTTKTMPVLKFDS